VSSVLIELWVPGSYLEYLWDLEKRVDEDWPAVAESLEADCFACMEGCHCEFDSR